MSALQQLRRGILHKFWQTAIESMRQASSTDDLEMLMLQFFAFRFVASSILQQVCSLVSVLNGSLKGVAAVYELRSGA